MTDWNSKEWKRKYYYSLNNGKRFELEKLRIEVIKDTLNRIGKDVIPSSPEGKKYCNPISINYSNNNKIEIKVINNDCLNFARKLDKTYKNITILNMANAYNPGGGVLFGSNAQEEYLCRCSNYFPGLNLMAKYYPIDSKNNCIYTKDVTVFRGTQEDGYPILDKEEIFVLDIIAVPAINHPKLTEYGLYTEEAEFETKEKIKTILNVSIINNTEVLILGAFGCGVFRNPPKEMARCFKEVLFNMNEYGNLKKVFFVIKEDSNSPKGGNFLPFFEILDGNIINTSFL